MSTRKFNSGLFSYETLVHAIAGSTGSIVALTTFYPLDTVRFRLQHLWVSGLRVCVSDEVCPYGNELILTDSTFVYLVTSLIHTFSHDLLAVEDRESKSTWALLLELVREEGFPTLYRGIFPVLKSLWASNFVYFYTFHGLKHLGSEKNDQNAAKDLLTASIAGVINVLTTTPLWVVNTRLKMKGLRNQNKNNYKGLLDGLMRISKEEGIKSLWNGTIPSLFLVTNPVIQFVIYEAVKRQLRRIYPDEKIGALAFFLIGAFSKAVATVLTYPIQLLQTKLRHGHNYPDLRRNAGMNEMVRHILRKQGIAGLFKGLEAKIFQTVLTAALMFATYEKISNFVFRVMKTKQKSY